MGKGQTEKCSPCTPDSIWGRPPIQNKEASAGPWRLPAPGQSFRSEDHRSPGLSALPPPAPAAAVHPGTSGKRKLPRSGILQTDTARLSRGRSRRRMLGIPVGIIHAGNSHAAGSQGYGNHSLIRDPRSDTGAVLIPAPTQMGVPSASPVSAAASRLIFPTAVPQGVGCGRSSSRFLLSSSAPPATDAQKSRSSRTDRHPDNRCSNHPLQSAQEIILYLYNPAYLFPGLRLIFPQPENFCNNPRWC